MKWTYGTKWLTYMWYHSFIWTAPIYLIHSPMRHVTQLWQSSTKPEGGYKSWAAQSAESSFSHVINSDDFLCPPTLLCYGWVLIGSSLEKGFNYLSSILFLVFCWYSILVKLKVSSFNLCMTNRKYHLWQFCVNSFSLVVCWQFLFKRLSLRNKRTYHVLDWGLNRCLGGEQVQKMIAT